MSSTDTVLEYFLMIKRALNQFSKAAFSLALLTLLSLALPPMSHAQNANETTDTAIADQVEKDANRFFEERGWAFGYIFGKLKAKNGDDLAGVNVMGRFGRRVNDKIGLDDHKGDVNFYLEPFIAHFWNPEGGVSLGLPIFFEYSYPLTDKLSVHTGFGSGPSYFGVDTIEEGSGGFQFFDSASAGFRYNFSEDESFNFEYRAVHISDLSIDSPNNGINAHAVYFGLFKKF